MASNAMQVLYSTIDMVIVGEYVGTFGLSAVSQASQIVNFATMVCLGFSNGGQVLVSQALGARKRKEVNEIIGTLFGFVLALSVVLTSILLIARAPILYLMNIPDESYGMTMEYLVICSAGLIFTAGYNMVSAVLRGMGDSKRPFLFIGIASVINLVLDLLFTGLFGWGVAGAAFATIIGQAVSFLFSIWYLYKKRTAFGFDFKKESFKPNRRYVGMIAGLGGLYYVMDYTNGVWSNNGFGDRGWLAIALVIFATWKPHIGIFGSYLFGGLYVLYNYIPVSMQMIPLLQMLPYVVTILVLVVVSIRKKRENQPPASLGLPYFREER